MSPARSCTSIVEMCIQCKDSSRTRSLIKKKNLHQCIRHFIAWSISQHIFAWKDISSDQELLQAVQWTKLEFEESPLQAGSLGFKIPKNQPLISTVTYKHFRRSEP